MKIHEILMDSNPLDCTTREANAGVGYALILAGVFTAIVFVVALLGVAEGEWGMHPLILSCLGMFPLSAVIVGRELSRGMQLRDYEFTRGRSRLITVRTVLCWLGLLLLTGILAWVGKEPSHRGGFSILAFLLVPPLLLGGVGFIQHVLGDALRIAGPEEVPFRTLDVDGWDIEFYRNGLLFKPRPRYSYNWIKIPRHLARRMLRLKQTRTYPCHLLVSIGKHPTVFALQPDQFDLLKDWMEHRR